MDLPDSRTVHAGLLLVRCRLGQPEALEELVHAWELRLLCYIRSFVENEQDAWDVLQQTWIRVLRGLGQLREPEHLPLWLYRIARNTALSHRHALAARERHIDDDIELEALNGEDPLPRVLNAQAVHAALTRLSTPHREILTLFFLQDLSIEQCAELLSLPVGTVKSRLHYAKRAMRQLLQTQD